MINFYKNPSLLFPSERVINISISPHVSFSLLYDPHAVALYNPITPLNSSISFFTILNIKVASSLGIRYSNSSTKFKHTN